MIERDWGIWRDYLFCEERKILCKEAFTISRLLRAANGLERLTSLRSTYPSSRPYSISRRSFAQGSTTPHVRIRHVVEICCT